MIVEAHDLAFCELGIIGDDRPGGMVFLSDDDTAQGFGGEVGMEKNGFDFGDPHTGFEALSSWGA